MKKKHEIEKLNEKLQCVWSNDFSNRHLSQFYESKKNFNQDESQNKRLITAIQKNIDDLDKKLKDYEKRRKILLQKKYFFNFKIIIILNV